MTDSASTDDLRIRIWDYLFQLNRAQQIEVIAAHLDETPQAIQHAVHNPWFNEQDGVVAIARSDN